MAGFSSDTLRSAMRHLKANDPKLATVIKKVGPPDVTTLRMRFATLVRSILSQQISGAAARTIQRRLQEKIGRFTADRICQLEVDELRELGVSKQKAGYLLDLAQKTQDGTLRFARHGRLNDEQVIEEVIQVKGIGRWTAHMYLIFSLGRCDIFPEDDLGVRNAMVAIYELNDDADRAQLRAIAEKWSPYRSIASWYCWRSLEL